LLRIDGQNITEIKLGDSNLLRIGEKVIAIGNPLGLSFSVSEGIVSGLDRMGPSGWNEYIQTDVSLNPGNSGGPLINSKGEVVGINNFKITDTEGLGFALRSNSIREVVNNITGRDLV
jgi:serine protease Do